MMSWKNLIRDCHNKHMYIVKYDNEHRRNMYVDVEYITMNETMILILAHLKGTHSVKINF